MKYFLYGYFGYDNLGDDLLLKTIIKEIEKKDDKAFFYVKSFNEVEIINQDNVCFTKVEQILSSNNNKILKVLHYLKRNFFYLKKSDYLIIGPGGLFIDKGKFSFSILFLFLFTVYSKWKHKKIVIMGISFDIVAEFKNLFLMKNIFKMANFISVRDSLSFSYIKYFQSKNSIKSIDILFSNSSDYKKEIVKEQKNKVGICFIDYYSNYENNYRKKEIFCKKIYNEIVENNDKKFTYISLQSSKGLDDDFIYNYLKEKKINIDYLCLNEDNIYLLNQFEYIISMRYHLAIFSLIFNKKILVINHEIKMASLDIDFKLSSVFIDDFFYEKNIFKNFFDNSNRINIKNIKALQKIAKDNFRWLK